jgi:outer membrane protein assembly factor BamE (lipoprotein component of BamABCDE complex)
MKKLPVIFASLLLSACAVFALSACDKGGAPVTNTRVTATNVAKIQPGMDRTQVEALLGAPATSETKDMLIFKKTTATYVEGKQSVEVIYKNNQVEEIHSTVGSAAASPAGETTSKTTTTTTTSN